MTINERITENIVRDTLHSLGYYAAEDIRIEEQKSQIAEVARLLKNGSKSGTGGRGCPEFIISSPSTPDFLIIVECKASLKCHESPGRSKPVEFAVDGAIHYGRLLSRLFNVVAIAVSGQTASSLKISSFVFSKGSENCNELKNESDVVVNELIPFEDFVRLASYDPSVSRSRHDDLMAFSRDLHDFMRDHAKLTESEKPLLVSGTLIGLRNKAFENSFGDYTPEDLQKQWLRVIRGEIEKADLPNGKKNSMTQPYSSIAVHPELGKSTSAFPKGVLHELIRKLHERVWRFVMVYHDFDVVGRFYGEFLKYTGGDKKALGIVLTPRHITELFALLANVKKDSKILDICAGTGGFLISSMHQMFKQAVTEKERTYIKKHCLIGVEQQPNMYALAASNMILRGDGKANLYQGSCFDAAITKAVKGHHCNIRLINPPYSQEDENQQELKFVQQMLDCLEKAGTGIAIVPMSCAIAPHPVREELLKHHTLEAVMSMPDELFYPVGVITCIMVFTAHVPHSVSKRKTWFGYWKTDGFFKTKHKGRIDGNETWPSIRDRWIEQFRNREVHPGQSVTRHVTHADEWCAEAYMETDYSILSQAHFEEVVKNYAVYRLIGLSPTAGEEEGDGNGR
ncbi:MAG: SAM-dependent methyltransferase [Acidobacteriota bacterium]|nr:SAM-dependent methyltransferase [Acidobacteriota bacterium]